MLIKSGLTLVETITVLSNNPNYKAVNTAVPWTGTYLRMDDSCTLKVYGDRDIELEGNIRIPTLRYDIHTLEETYSFHEVLARLESGDPNKFIRLGISGHTSPIIYGRKTASGGISIVKRKEGSLETAGQWSDVSFSSEMLLAKDWMVYKGD